MSCDVESLSAMDGAARAEKRARSFRRQASGSPADESSPRTVSGARAPRRGLGEVAGRARRRRRALRRRGPGRCRRGAGAGESPRRSSSSRAWPPIRGQGELHVEDDEVGRQPLGSLQAGWPWRSRSASPSCAASRRAPGGVGVARPPAAPAARRSPRRGALREDPRTGRARRSATPGSRRQEAAAVLRHSGSATSSGTSSVARGDLEPEGAIPCAPRSRGDLPWGSSMMAC